MRMYYDIQLNDRTITKRELHGEEIVRAGRYLIAKKLLVEDCVTFTLLWNTDGTFSLQSAANGRFVAAPPTSFGGPLIADRLEIHPSETSWEKFDLVSAFSGVVW